LTTNFVRIPLLSWPETLAPQWFYEFRDRN
jgi:hypothetical protein